MYISEGNGNEWKLLFGAPCGCEGRTAKGITLTQSLPWLLTTTNGARRDGSSARPQSFNFQYSVISWKNHEQGESHVVAGGNGSSTKASRT